MVRRWRHPRERRLRLPGCRGGILQNILAGQQGHAARRHRRDVLSFAEKFRALGLASPAQRHHRAFSRLLQPIWIGSPQKVPSLTLQDLRDDPVLSEMPLVRQNTQGINGRRIEKRHYDRLAALWTGRGMDPSLLPMLDGLDLDAGE